MFTAEPSDREELGARQVLPGGAGTQQQDFVERPRERSRAESGGTHQPSPIQTRTRFPSPGGRSGSSPISVPYNQKLLWLEEGSDLTLTQI